MTPKKTIARQVGVTNMKNEKLVKRWIGMELSNRSGLFYLFGSNMYPKFFKTRKDVLGYSPPDAHIIAVSVMVPISKADGDDQ